MNNFRTTLRNKNLIKIKIKINYYEVLRFIYLFISRINIYKSVIN